MSYKGVAGSTMNHNLEIKLIALDMDGTLLNEQGEISPGNRNAIKEAEAKGVPVVLSTGRSLLTCRDHAQSLELSSYLVTVNGSEIWSGDGELVERNMVDVEHIQWMHELAKKYQAKFWATATNNVWKNEMPEKLTDHMWLKFGFDDIKQDHVRNTILEQLQTKGLFEISNSSPYNIEINPLGINKAKALERVSDLLGLTLNHVMSVGDSMNDIAMIKAAGLGVAMGNAQDIVKEAADWVTATNEEDGVAQAIREWVLK